jgi:putative methionine-R-sulfoxide reductase with GAF domain
MTDDPHATRPGDERDRRLARRQSALLRLSAGIAAAQNEAEVYRRVVDGLHDEALGYDFLGLFLLDKESGDRVLQASIGWPDAPQNWRVPEGQGLSERPLLDGQLHYTPEVSRESRYLPSLASGSEVDVPLRVEGKTIGVLVVESAEPNAFDGEDFEILTAAANQASTSRSAARGTWRKSGSESTSWRRCSTRWRTCRRTSSFRGCCRRCWSAR